MDFLLLSQFLESIETTRHEFINHCRTIIEAELPTFQYSPQLIEKKSLPGAGDAIDANDYGLFAKNGLVVFGAFEYSTGC